LCFFLKNKALFFEKNKQKAFARLIPRPRRQTRVGRRKGRHRAALNIGDCFAYALAAATGAPRPFRGRAFTRTDIRSALPC